MSDIDTVATRRREVALTVIVLILLALNLLLPARTAGRADMSATAARPEAIGQAN